jgi:hypothetical protein
VSGGLTLPSKWGCDKNGLFITIIQGQPLFCMELGRIEWYNGNPYLYDLKTKFFLKDNLFDLNKR